MTDAERIEFETGERAGEQAIAGILAAMPAGDCALKNELFMALADGTRGEPCPATTGFLVGACGQIALALLSLASHQPTTTTTH